MKKNKILICFAALATPTILSSALASCSKSKDTPETNVYSINFSASEGIELSSTATIKVKKGTYWKDLVKENKIPTVLSGEEFTKLGWCVVDSQGQYKFIEDEYIVESNINVKYIGYNSIQHPSISVNVDYLPGSPESERVALDFAGGLTFKSFRNYYNLPTTPKLDGYEFDGWYSGQTSVDDNFTFPSVTTPLTIKWIAHKHKVSFTTDGNGTVTYSKDEFDYGKTWGEIQTELSVTPQPYDTDHEFLKWVDKDGDDLADTTVMKEDFTAKALFKTVEKVQIKFTCSDGCTLQDGQGPAATTITKQIKRGTTWGQLIDSASIPTPVYDTTQYDPLGWVAVTQSGEYVEITRESIIDGATNVKYIILEKAKTWIDVTFIYGPNGESEVLKFVQGWNFSDFKIYYGIPDELHYEGYVFNGYYCGEELMTDWSALPTTGTVEIKASLTPQFFTVQLSASEHGSITTAKTLNIKYGTKWKDITPTIDTLADAGYSLEKWVNMADGKIIDENYEIKSSLNAYAVFTSWTTKVEIIDTNDHYTRSLYNETTSHGASVDVKYNDTIKGYIGGSKQAYNAPVASGSKLNLSNYEPTCNFRFITVPLKISVPVFARTTKKYKLHLNVEHHSTLKAFIGDTHTQSTFEVFKLSDINDHPEFFANCKSDEDTRPSDQRSLFRSTVSYTDRSWNDSHKTFKNSVDLGTFEEVNDTDQTKMVIHYLEVSFMVEGNNSKRNGRETHEIIAEFTAKDIE